jgi:hypothetical protein
MPASTGAVSSTAFRSLPTEETGIYTLRPLSGDSSSQVQKGVQAIAVNLAPEESDLRSVSKEEWNLFWQKSGFNPERVQRIGADAPLQSAIKESRYGVELWSLFVMLALACAGAEMIVGRANNDAGTTEDRHARTA